MFEGWALVFVVAAAAFYIARLERVSDARHRHTAELLERIDQNLGQILLRIDNGHLACRAPEPDQFFTTK
jgi:hypothetical protein